MRTQLKHYYTKLGLSVSALVVIGVLLTPAFASAATIVVPSSMAALGDSLTRGYNSPVTGCGQGNDCVKESWSTGSDPLVDSHFQRFARYNTSLTAASVYNDAKSGTKIAALNGSTGQVATAVSQYVDYVTILMGANDACTTSTTTMTTVANFTASAQAALRSLTSGLPNAMIAVASVPNLYNLWDMGHTDPTVVATWQKYKVCPSMLANATSTASPDVTRRALVQQRTIDFNTALQNACAAYANCKFDNGAVYNLQYSSTDLSHFDYFHLAPSGQAKLADAVWRNATAQFDPSIIDW